MLTFYDVLEVSLNASQEEIIKNYNRLKIVEMSEREKIILRQAYKILSDPMTRHIYNKKLLNCKLGIDIMENFIIGISDEIPITKKLSSIERRQHIKKLKDGRYMYFIEENRNGEIKRKICIKDKDKIEEISEDKAMEILKSEDLIRITKSIEDKLS